MSGFLHNLVARSLRQAEVVQPRIPVTFEPTPVAEPSTGEPPLDAPPADSPTTSQESGVEEEPAPAAPRRPTFAA